MEQQKKGVPVWVWLLALIPVAISALGIASALAIYGVRKYMVSAKTAEAHTTLATWGTGLARCAEKEGRLPASTTPVPASLSEVKGKKYQASAAEWAEPAHTCAAFAFNGPQYFQYRWERQADEAGSLHAVADLNGDAVADVEVQLELTCSGGKCATGTAVTKSDDGSASESASSGAESAAHTMGEKAAGVLVIVCLLVNLAAGVWLLVLAFQESIAWGLLCLFVPCTQLVFAFKFWDRTKRAFLLSLGSGGALLVGGVILAALDDTKSPFSAAAPAPSAGAPLVAVQPPHSGPGVRLPPPPPVVAVPELTGAPVDLSTVMGKARKLANQWEQDAALLSIEATLAAGVIPTADGGTAKLTFGPSPFESVARKSGVFIVTYDKAGIVGAPAKAPPGKALPEPMCGPEAVYGKVAAGEAPAVTLRYGFDSVGRAAWIVNPSAAGPPRLFEPQRCDPMGVVAGRVAR